MTEGTLKAAAFLGPLPPGGDGTKRIQELVATSRQNVLDHHVRKLTSTRDAERFVELAEHFSAVPWPLRAAILATSHFGSWQFQMRRCLEDSFAGVSAKADLASLLSEFDVFLMVPTLVAMEPITLRLQVRATGQKFIPLVGWRAFVALQERIATNRHIEVRVRQGELRFIFASGEWALSELKSIDGTRRKSGVLGRLEDLDGGLYRDYRLNAADMDIGRPIAWFYQQSMRQMAATAPCAEGQQSADLQFTPDATSFAAEIETSVRLLAHLWPAVFPDIPAFVRTVVPIDSNQVFSYSELATLGVVFLRTRSQNPLWHAELLLHEFAHTWLATLMALLFIVNDDTSALHVSPWRDDPRPIHGILFGTHAFALVTEFLCNAIGQGIIADELLAERIALEWRRVRAGYDIIQRSARFSNAGEIFYNQLSRYIARVGEMVATLESKVTAKSGHSHSELWPTAIEP